MVMGGGVITGTRFVDVLWGREVGCCSAGKIDTESGLGRFGRLFSASIWLHQEALEVLTLRLVREETDGFSVVWIPSHGIAGADFMDFSEGEERENSVNEGGDCRKGEGGNGR